MDEKETFKAGERVVRLYGSYDAGKIVTIERITPTGLIVIGGEKFRPNGYLQKREKWQFTRIVKLTPERQAAIARANCVGIVKSFNLECLPDDELARLAGIINEIRKAAEAKKLFGKE